MQNINQNIEIKCVKEALDSDGVKIMQFTKGNTYAATYVEDGDDTHWAVEDDKGEDERFFKLDIMFEII